MSETHHFFLVPGFFGFVNMGEFKYFSHPVHYLKSRGRELGKTVRVTSVGTHPTASLRKRSLLLFETIRRESRDHSGPLHLVGHSTGGLDGRLLLTPGAVLKKNLDLEPWISRVKTLVSISTPHYGAPLAKYFGGSMGGPLLKLLSLTTIYTLRYGHLPLSFILKLSSLLFRLDNIVGWRNTVADQLFDELLSGFFPIRRKQVSNWFREIGSDQDLLFQLTPSAMDVFNASTGDNPETRYASVITMGRRPGPGGRLASGLNPYNQATHTAYEVFHRFAALGSKMASHLTLQQESAIKHTLFRMPSARDNDGVVPTLSQPWGEVIHAVRGDHLDIIGHFSGENLDPPHVDWLSSGSGFTKMDFETTWNKILQFCLFDNKRNK